MVKILENKKHVFWQAFFMTVLFFGLGLVFGVYLEQLRTDEINTIFYNSEASLYDSFALGQLFNDPSVSCDSLNEISVTFADKIYNEARDLEKFDDSNKLTDSLKAVHKKYDLLRTLLWMNIISARENCANINTVVYFYEYDAEEVSLRAKQTVWERILGDLKAQLGNEIILIPIAVDQEITSLDFLLKKYNIEEFPAVIINEKVILYEHETVEELVKYFNLSPKS